MEKFKELTKEEKEIFDKELKRAENLIFRREELPRGFEGNSLFQ